MPIRALLLFLIFCFCTGCSSGIIPCPEVKGLKLKKSQVNKRIRFPDRTIAREEPEPVITVSSDANTPQPGPRNSQRYRYVKYTIEHVDVEDLECPKPGDKKKPRAVRENIRKNKKRIRYYYEVPAADSIASLRATYSERTR